MLVKDLAASLGASWEGDGSRALKRVASLEEAGPDELSFVSHIRFHAQAEASEAACLLVGEAYPNHAGQTLIRVRDPRAAVVVAIAHLHPPKSLLAGIHPTAVVSPTAKISSGASIAPHVTI